jgi:hypothetical protein
MKPEVYKTEAKQRIDLFLIGLTTHYGAWNADKILREIERQLKQRRLEAKKNEQNQNVK